MAEGFITRRGTKAEQPTYTVATGGTESTITSGSDTYKVHTFTSSGTFAITSLGNAVGSNSLDVLVVAGGGGGGSWGAGGGGAGGLVFVPNFQINNVTNYSVIVGPGGTGKLGYTTANQGTNGNNSSVFGLTAVGGGVGGSGRGNNIQLPGNGGSGGGSSHDGEWFNAGGRSALQPSQSGLSGSPYGFGTTGGYGFGTQNWATAAGGGGAGEGSNSSSATPPDGTGALGIPPRGGNGLSQVVINGTTYNFASIFPLANIGQNVNGQLYFAGGGGAGGSGTGTGQRIGGAGGLGGGGTGGQGQGTSTSIYYGVDGTANTGGGGGGGGASYDVAQSNAKGGNGGSGIVIIRYKIGG